MTLATQVVDSAAHPETTGQATDKAIDWRHVSACRPSRGVDPELFFPIGTSGPALLQLEQAKAICRSCPVVAECLQFAMESGQDAGVFGGLSEEERRALKRRGSFRTQPRSA